MPTFIEIQTDAFSNNIGNIESGVKHRVDQTDVRRPFRGIQIKDDTYSVMKVIRADGAEVPLVDAGGSNRAQSGSQTSAGSGVAGDTSRQAMTTTYNYANFIIQSISDVRQEKSQILETFGDTFIFFFGERPRILQVSGVLFNTLDFNWRTEFWYNYETTLRGTKLVEQNARLYLYFDDVVVEGYMLGAQAQDVAEAPYHIPFTFTLFVTNHTYLSSIGDDDFPVTSAVNIEPLQRAMDMGSALRELKVDAIQAKHIESTTQAVVRANMELQAEYTKSVRGVGTAAGSFVASKNLLANAMIMGIGAAQGLTFLSIANHFFKNRVTRFPRGIAGAESYAGPPQYANEPNPFSARPKRTLPLRSKIRDNVDEYVKGSITNANLDQDAIRKAQLEQQNMRFEDLELNALIALADMGLDPIQHPGGSPFEMPHVLKLMGLSPTDIAEFAV